MVKPLSAGAVHRVKRIGGRAPLEEKRSARRVHSQPLEISEGDRVATVLAEPVPAWWEKQSGTTPRQRRDSPLDTGTSVIGIWGSPMIND